MEYSPLENTTLARIRKLCIELFRTTSYLIMLLKLGGSVQEDKRLEARNMAGMEVGQDCSTIVHFSREVL